MGFRELYVKNLESSMTELQLRKVYRKLYVKNLDSSVTELRLREVFTKFGLFDLVELTLDLETGQHVQRFWIPYTYYFPSVVCPT